MPAIGWTDWFGEKMGRPAAMIYPVADRAGKVYFVVLLFCQLLSYDVIYFCPPSDAQFCSLERLFSICTPL